MLAGLLSREDDWREEIKERSSTKGEDFKAYTFRALITIFRAHHPYRHLRLCTVMKLLDKSWGMLHVFIALPESRKCLRKMCCGRWKRVCNLENWRALFAERKFSANWCTYVHPEHSLVWYGS